MVRVVKHWHMLSGDIVEPSSVKVLKARLDGALSSQV